MIGGRNVGPFAGRELGSTRGKTGGHRNRAIGFDDDRTAPAGSCATASTASSGRARRAARAATPAHVLRTGIPASRRVVAPTGLCCLLLTPAVLTLTPPVLAEPPLPCSPEPPVPLVSSHPGRSRYLALQPTKRRVRR